MFEQLNGALSLMQAGPRALAPALAASAAVNEIIDPASIDDLAAHLEQASAGDGAAQVFRRALAGWDNDAEPSWADGTERNSESRRVKIYELLKLGDGFRMLCDGKFSYHRLDPPSVIASAHDHWYDEARRRERSFYWDAYSGELARQGWSQESVDALNDSTTSIVERLSDPSRPEVYQSKGLVVGYVQSGKTANFTGVVAKAADAGYRLIIVLAGTLDVLRNQTQRRIDKDLIGRELLDRDYVADADWERFLSHGAKPSSLGSVDFQRLTGPESDYRELGRTVAALAFEKADPAQDYWAPDNLAAASPRIAVVKKNSKVVGKLLKDLRLLSRTRTGAPLDQVPALIIDDESDQASINSNKPATDPEEQERTATNLVIIELLRLLPRAQYLGYTATPFANVFVDVNNPEDIFPRDYIVSLPRPEGYMGVADFFDRDGSTLDETTCPNRRDYVRAVVGNDGTAANLPKAIDSFVLAGALKLFRESKGAPPFRHHTMLAHVSSRVSDHEDLADEVRKALRKAQYHAGKGLDRLKALLESDFRPVSGCREPDLPFPETFEDLEEHIGEALARIGDADEAVRILNNENKDQTPDFDKSPIWKILVGGTKLSRGYTVEGLTISYYRRRAQTADTLMQMGRWFGFRRGYRDLVRLFIGTDEWIDKAGRKRIDLYEAFGAVCRDEELFREELKRYASMEDPRITPLQIPPLVPMHMLKPTATNKMYNAKVTFRNFGGQLAESTFAAGEKADIRHNFDLVADIIAERGVETVRFEGRPKLGNGALGANVSILTPTDVERIIKGFLWHGRRERATALNPLQQQLEFLLAQGDRAPGIDDWVLISPLFEKPAARFNLAGATFDVVYRRYDGARFTTYNDPIHRQYAAHIAGHQGAAISGMNAALADLTRPRRGAILFYPVTGTSSGKISAPYSPGLTFLFPPNGVSRPVSFGVIRKDAPDAAVVSPP